ncbi:MAG TPA: hypothetical protein DCF95_05775, partial [Gammaproteobacteria bacterium]|nr:hypothetical protein [Gammaproteobacteria bacterium]
VNVSGRDGSALEFPARVTKSKSPNFFGPSTIAHRDYATKQETRFHKAGKPHFMSFLAIYAKIDTIVTATIFLKFQGIFVTIWKIE